MKREGEREKGRGREREGETAVVPMAEVEGSVLSGMCMLVFLHDEK